jgi:nitroimidazol reductase NimA-like FMN-containing flavoprotein (pyridoxamine 5'-phosphate oxidase superfamily)
MSSGMAGERAPQSAGVITTGAPEGRDPLAWAVARDRLADERFYWLATVHPGGRPHVRPVLAIWMDGNLHTTSNPAAQKGRNLEREGRCSFTVSTPGLDLVVEGTAAAVIDAALLQRVAAEYFAKYQWPAEVKDGAFDAPYGAPTAGPPPYRVYQIVPEVVFGFGTDDPFAPHSTRWQF